MTRTPGNSSKVQPRLDAGRILVVEPHPVCRFALVHLLRDAGPPLTLAGDTATLADAHHVMPTVRAGTVLIAVDDTADWESIERFVRMTNVHVVILASRDDGETAFAAVRAGAAGVVPKSVDPQELLSTLRSVAAGEIVFHSSVTYGALMWAAERENRSAELRGRYASLTRRERTILQYLARGLMARKIAERLVISRRTVEWYLHQVYRKLGVNGRIQAMTAYNRLHEAGLDLHATERAGEQERLTVPA